MKNKKNDPEESLEKFRTDLAEYNFILEQQLKKIKPIKSVKKNSYRLKKIYRILRRGVYISFFFYKIFLLFFKA